MKQGFWFLCAIIVAALIGGSLASVSAQVSSPTPDPFAVQLTSSPVSTFNTLSSDISADGRFVVFTSSGDIATVNKNNADGNREIFLFDYAQRRIYQITNTKNVPIPAASPSPTPSPSPSPSPTASPSPTPTPLPTPADRSLVKIEIDNRNPMISMEPVLEGGVRSYVIVFSSNAPHPANFNGVEGTDPTVDWNSEIWIYKLPPVADVDLTLGTDILTPLDFPVRESDFQRITFTTASRAPTPGSATASPFFADDNREATISDDGTVIAFISTRNIAGALGAGNPDFNPELFIFTRAGGTLRQITDTKDAIPGLGFIFQTNPSLSHDGTRVAFMSSANSFNMSAQTPITFTNPDTNAEVYYADLNGTITFHQVTRTQNNITTANLLSPGRRLSRDGKLITFESKATDPKSGNAPTGQIFGTFVYTIAGDTFNEVGTRPPIGDVIRFPTFTDYDSTLAPSSLVFASFLNFRPNGTFPDSAATANEGINTDNSVDLFLTQVPVTSSSNFTRITNVVGFSGGTRAIASASRKRIAFSIGGNELGGGNTDGSTELFYLLTPIITTQSSAALSFFTGASEMPVAAATPIPSPTPSPTPTPSPVPGQPIGVAPGELTIVRSTVALAPSDAATTGDVKETTRTPALPIELNGVSLSVNGHAAGLYKVLNADKQINFVVPIGTPAGVRTVAINILDAGANTDTLLRGLLQIISGQPDIFTFPGNRAAALTTQGLAEPFNVTTEGNATVISLSVTGVRSATVGEITVTVGTTAITGTSIISVRPNTNMPGFDIIDFALPASLAGAGDVPVQVTFTRTNGGTFVSRPADSAPRITIN
ncbi:MAG TPA: hypothetical protein VJR02_15675 [Pyrinomonadaceae bacterium]|nr:hypothetical protein [Pyrinomonadaceae bacterium]